MFLHDTPKAREFQVHMNAYAHNSQPLLELNFSPHEIVFHTRQRNPLTSDLNLSRNTSKTCISQYCSQLLNTHILIKRTYVPSFTKPFQSLFPNIALLWKPHCYQVTLQYMNILLK